MFKLALSALFILLMSFPSFSQPETSTKLDTGYYYRDGYPCYFMLNQVKDKVIVQIFSRGVGCKEKGLTQVYKRSFKHANLYFNLRELGEKKVVLYSLYVTEEGTLYLTELMRGELKLTLDEAWAEMRNKFLSESDLDDFLEGTMYLFKEK